ncbi:MAG TPA: hypothetical protein VIL14_03765, partial [Nitrososphaeraceae archaeon]
PSTVADRTLRNKPAKNRPKFENVKWDGLSEHFKIFRRSIEGHLIQAGAGYLTEDEFIKSYKSCKYDDIDYLETNDFWNTYKISIPQAKHDRQFLYGMLLTATIKLQHKTIIKYQKGYDGIMAWDELIAEYECDGFMELRVEQLETLIHVPYNTSESVVKYIEKFQAYLEELISMKPNDYSNSTMKRMLLKSLKTAPHIAHLVQKCRDSSSMNYDDTARYLRSNSILVDNVNSLKPPSRLMHVEDRTSRIEEPKDKTLEQVTQLFHTIATQNGMYTTYKMFNTQQFRDSLRIPPAIWAELEPSIREKINEARERAKKKRPYNNNHSGENKKHDNKQENNHASSAAKIPHQYPNVPPRSSVANLVNSLADIDLNEDNSEDTDDDMLECSAYMVRRSIPIDPPSDIIDVKAHFEYIDNSIYDNKIYAISDGGADSCILGKYAKVIDYTGRYANLVGYDPKTTRTDKVPIVTALIKAISLIDKIPVILKVNEAPYNPSTPITLLSEYQIREYGLVIDSVAKKHYSSTKTKGTQRFQVNQWVHINFEDRGGLMGFELMPIEKGDEQRYDVITITSPEKWIPHKFQRQNIDEISPYDPSDLDSDQNYDYPAVLNHTS